MRYVSCAVALLVVGSAAQAAPADRHAWWECHKQADPPHASCCSEADGHLLSSGEWGTTGDRANPFWVEVDGKQYLIPAYVVIGNQCGPDPSSNAAAAKIWYIRMNYESGLQLDVLCFLPGTMF